MPQPQFDPANFWFRTLAGGLPQLPFLVELDDPGARRGVEFFQECGDRLFQPVELRLVGLQPEHRVAVLEILKSTMRTREYIEKGEAEGKSLLDAMRDGELDGMQYFDGEIEKLVRSKTISMATALLYATNAGNLQVQLADLAGQE